MAKGDHEDKTVNEPHAEMLAAIRSEVAAKRAEGSEPLAPMDAPDSDEAEPKTEPAALAAKPEASANTPKPAPPPRPPSSPKLVMPAEPSAEPRSALEPLERTQFVEPIVREHGGYTKTELLMLIGAVSLALAIIAGVFVYMRGL
jgi:hypothetical protein